MSRATLSKAICDNDLNLLENTLEEKPSLVNKENDDHETPIEECLNTHWLKDKYRRFRGYEALEILVRSGGDVNAKCKNRKLNVSSIYDWTPLILAVENNCLRSVRCLFKKGARLDTVTSDGKTALLFALERDNLGCAKVLIQYCTPEVLNHADNDGQNALMWAMKCKDNGHAHSLCLQLVTAGADVNIAKRDKETALTLAIKHGHLKCVTLIIERASPALINHKGVGGSTALVVASGRPRQQAEPLCTQLIEAGADPTAANNDGKTALIHSIERANIECAIFLIQQATPESINQKDTSGSSALICAMRQEERDGDLLSLCRQLQAAGARVEITDNQIKTALIVAIENDNLQCAVFLIPQCTPAVINNPDKDGWTALMYLMMSSSDEEVYSVCAQLVTAGADINMTTSNSKETALSFAIEHKRMKCANLFIQIASTSLINHRRSDGSTALVQASKMQDQEMAASLCKQLLESGADLNVAANDGTTAIKNALRNNNYQCVKFLIQHAPPASVNQIDEDEMTALWAVAFQENSLSFCEQLLAVGARVNLRDTDGQTVLERAAERGLEEIVSCLLENGAIVDTVSAQGETPLYHAVCRSASLLENFLRIGADPTLSVTHEILAHLAIVDDNAAKLRMLVMNGFPPQDCRLQRCQLLWLADYDTIFMLSKWPVSPLALALFKGRPDIARYLIKNKFFTLSDIERNLYRDSDFRRFVERFSTRECLQLLDFHVHSVPRLSTLCLVTISSALTQNFRREDVGEVQHSPNFLFKPTFRERVTRLGLPPMLQRALLHKTPVARICCRQWNNIVVQNPLQYIPECEKCPKCRGQE